jgi:hypothetical protein
MHHAFVVDENVLCKKTVGLFGESREQYIFVNALPFGQNSKENLKVYKVSQYFSSL